MDGSDRRAVDLHRGAEEWVSSRLLRRGTVWVCAKWYSLDLLKGVPAAMNSTSVMIKFNTFQTLTDERWYYTIARNVSLSGYYPAK